MHSVLQRGNAILAYALSVLACVTFACFLSTVFLNYRTDASINTVTVLVWVPKINSSRILLTLPCPSRKNVPNYSASRELNDLGFITFDLQTNLTNLFNWNVKQLFLFLTAEYESPTNQLNQVVLWDKIIQRGENAVLDFKNMNTKYYFWDDGNWLK